jgi:4-aminobutyrate aminotransferase-like enzyme
VFSRREKALLTLAAVAVAVVLCVQLSGTFAGPSAAERSGDVAQSEALRRRVNDADARLRQITIPGPQAATRLLRAVQASGSAAGVTIAFARPRRATKTSSGALEQALEIQASGPFPKIARFMFDLEARNANLRIARAAITSSDAASDKVSCAITIAAYSPGVIKQWKKNEPTSHGGASPR